jgi:hypothetical protein
MPKKYNDCSMLLQFLEWDYQTSRSDDCSVFVALALQCGTTKFKDCRKYYTSHQRDMSICRRNMKLHQRIGLKPIFPTLLHFNPEHKRSIQLETVNTHPSDYVNNPLDCKTRTVTFTYELNVKSLHSKGSSVYKQARSHRLGTILHGVYFAIFLPVIIKIPSQKQAYLNENLRFNCLILLYLQTDRTEYRQHNLNFPTHSNSLPLVSLAENL